MEFFGYALGLESPSGEAITTESGYHDLEPGWNEISVPAVYGWWDTTIPGDPLVVNKLVQDATRATVENYVIAQLVERYGAGCVEVAIHRSGDAQAWLSFIPGETPLDQPGNFTLVYIEEDDSLEKIGFLIKSLHPTAMRLDWTGWTEPA